MQLNEDVAWQRMLDLQREMENSRLLANQGVPSLARLAQLVAGRMWAVAGSLRPVQREEPTAGESDSVTDAA